MQSSREQPQNHTVTSASGVYLHHAKDGSVIPESSPQAHNLHGVKETLERPP